MITKIESLIENLIPSARPRAQESSTLTPSLTPLPPNYLNLQWKGIGVILDFGWKRSEEGLKWELENEYYGSESYSGPHGMRGKELGEVEERRWWLGHL
jgi:hypothetical protein